MKYDLQIRAFLPEDSTRLVAIWRAASEKGHPFLAREQLDAQATLVADHYLPLAETHVALRNGEIVGFISLLDQTIGGLFVDPSHHGTGIGRHLVDHASRLRPRLELEVYTLNESARRFYDRLGFIETGRRPTDDSGLPFELIKLVR
ncbi:GNAT family N-acetyltransferase [Allorhizobium sp. NPDC080224]|uniref:GNAT family N-acetyltransferase n=1 Tax=Allorhizobium sp. NPDC080224 TaxID=3390547 RepID=UPI003CFF631F